VKERTGVAVPESLVRLPQQEMIDGVTELARTTSARSGQARGGVDALAGALRAAEQDRRKWKDMLYNMDQLRDMVGMRSFAQQDPKLEFQARRHRAVRDHDGRDRRDVTTLVFRMSEVPEDEARLARRWQAAEYRKDE